MSTVSWITVRGLFGRRRFLLLLPLPVLLVGLAVLSRGLGVEPTDWGPPVLVGLGLAVVLPVVSLIVGTGVLGAEIDDGTVVHVLTTPLPRSQIVLPKLAVAAGVTAVTVAVRCSRRACWPIRYASARRSPSPRRSVRWPTRRCSWRPACSPGDRCCSVWSTC